MIILIEIMTDKWKSLSELDIVTGLDMGWCSELRLLVLHNSYLYCLCTTTTTKKKKKVQTKDKQTNRCFVQGKENTKVAKAGVMYVWMLAGPSFRSKVVHHFQCSLLFLYFICGISGSLSVVVYCAMLLIKTKFPLKLRICFVRASSKMEGKKIKCMM